MDEFPATDQPVAQPAEPALPPPAITPDEIATPSPALVHGREEQLLAAIDAITDAEISAALQELAAPASDSPALVDTVVALLAALDLEQPGLPEPIEHAWNDLHDGLSAAEPWRREWLEAQSRELLAAIAAAPLGWESDEVRAARQAVERALEDSRRAQSAPPPSPAQTTLSEPPQSPHQSPHQSLLTLDGADAATITLSLSPEVTAALPAGLLSDLGGATAAYAPDPAIALREQLAALTAERDGIHATWVETAAERDAAIAARDEARSGWAYSLEERDAAQRARDALELEVSTQEQQRLGLINQLDAALAEAATLREREAATAARTEQAEAEARAMRTERDLIEAAASAQACAAEHRFDQLLLEVRGKFGEELAVAHGERDLAVSAKAEAQTLLSGAQAEAERLRSQLAERLVELSAAHEERATVAEERDTARAALAALEARAQRAEAEAQAAGRARDLNHADFARAQAREREINRDLLAVRDEAAELRTRLATLEAQTTTHRETLARAAELARQLEDQKAEAETRANGAIAMSRELRTQAHMLSDVLRDAHFELGQLARALQREAGWFPGRLCRARLTGAEQMRGRIQAILPEYLPAAHTEAA